MNTKRLNICSFLSVTLSSFLFLFSPYFYVIFFFFLHIWKKSQPFKKNKNNKKISISFSYDFEIIIANIM